MRLKHCQHPLATSRPRSFQCRANFRRVMRVIVNKQKAFTLIFDLEPASRVFEFAQGSCDLFKRNSKFYCKRDDTESIVDIVRPGHVEHRLAEFLLAKVNAKI